MEFMSHISELSRIYMMGATTSVRAQGGVTEDFSIKIGLHQGSSLSPYLFILILDILTGHI